MRTDREESRKNKRGKAEAESALRALEEQVTCFTCFSNVLVKQVN
jgi:hypothetical protein